MFAEFNRGDLVWFDPGIGYVLPGEVLEFHQQAQVRSISSHKAREFSLMKSFLIMFQYVLQMSHLRKCFLLSCPCKKERCLCVSSTSPDL